MFYLIIVKIVFVILTIMMVLIPFSYRIAKLYHSVFGNTFVGQISKAFSSEEESNVTHRDNSQEWLLIALLINWVILGFVNIFAALLWPALLIFILLYKFI